MALKQDAGPQGHSDLKKRVSLEVADDKRHHLKELADQTRYKFSAQAQECMRKVGPMLKSLQARNMVPVEKYIQVQDL